MGFEPTTFSLARRRTTTVLRPQVAHRVQAESAESRDRTGDTAIFSRVLYQLSYLGLAILSLERRDFTRRERDCQAEPSKTFYTLFTSTPSPGYLPDLHCW